MKPSFGFVSLIFYFVLNETNCNVLRQKSIQINSQKKSDVSSLSINIIPNAEGYVVNGFRVKIEDFPWIVSLMKSDVHRCGGSILSATRVVTAAHCTVGISANMLKIRAGSPNRRTGGHVVPVSKIIDHAGYQNVDNDISMLFLEWPLQMSSKIGVIGLPEEYEHIAEGTFLKVAGWGRTSEFGTSTDYLMATTMPVIERDRCNEMLGHVAEVTDSMICTGFEKGGTDACFGDSGGPLTLSNKTLIGIVSWGIGCARPHKPGVYTNVASFTRWIASHL